MTRAWNLLCCAADEERCSIFDMDIRRKLCNQNDKSMAAILSCGTGRWHCDPMGMSQKVKCLLSHV